MQPINGYGPAECEKRSADLPSTACQTVRRDRRILQHISRPQVLGHDRGIAFVGSFKFCEFFKKFEKNWEAFKWPFLGGFGGPGWARICIRVTVKRMQNLRIFGGIKEGFVTDFRF